MNLENKLELNVPEQEDLDKSIEEFIKNNFLYDSFRAERIEDPLNDIISYKVILESQESRKVYLLSLEKIKGDDKQKYQLTVKDKTEIAEQFERAAKIWKELGLPEFKVHGYLDGKNKEYGFTELLDTVASRVRERY